MGGKWRRPYENAEGVLVKECSKCLRHRPVEDFNLYDPKRDSKRLRANCRECQAGVARAWRGRNADHVRVFRRHQKREQMKDPRTRLDEKMRTGIWAGLIGFSSGRSAFENLEFSPQELRDHLESQFTGKMSWNTYGRFGWHVEHRKPLAAFTYETPDDPQFSEAWALSNLRPLWWHENAWKGARYNAANDNEVSLDFRGNPVAA